jgi:hypothetical protein
MKVLNFAIADLHRLSLVLEEIYFVLLISFHCSIA